MITKPTFKPWFHVELADEIYLLSERGHFALRGEIYRRLAPLLDGWRTTDEIIDELADQATAAEVYYALAELEAKGYVIERDGAIPPERARFWQARGLDATEAERRLRESVVGLTAFGGVVTDCFGSALATLGLRQGDDGNLDVVLTDDYLQEGLSDFNAAALASGRPWLLAKPVGTILWLGPVFRPGQTGCWECLAQRLRANRAVESYLQHVKNTRAPFPVSGAMLSSTILTAANLIATEAAGVVVSDPPPGGPTTMTTLDLLTLQTQKHTLVRRPQCPSCRNGRSQANREAVPLVFESRPKRFTADGGHRTVTPEETLARYEHHISSITGAVGLLERVPVDGDDRFLHVYASHDSVSLRFGDPIGLRDRLRHKSSGKGVGDSQARASGLCEGLERYSGVFQGDEMRRRASYRSLGSAAIHPNACMLFSAGQYARRSECNVWESKRHDVPEPLDDEAELEWTPVWSLSARQFRYLPTSYLYYGYPAAEGPRCCRADSNGSAAGNTIEEAVLQGFMELVERDSVALWWYNRIRRPAVDLDSFDEPYIGALRSYYVGLGRDVWVLDLTSDLGIPVFAALARRSDHMQEQIILGFGAHFDPRIGILRALTEMNQGAAFGYGKGPDPLYDPDSARWWTEATVANQPYLAPNATSPRTRSDYPVQWSADLREDVLRCQEIVERQGLEMLVLEQTRPDIGLPVVKVIVPGLRHFWVRFAPGRLYEVPVRLGWLVQPVAESDLNPTPMFF